MPPTSAAQPAPVGHGRGVGEEDEVAARHIGGGQALGGHLDLAPRRSGRCRRSRRRRGCRRRSRRPAAAPSLEIGRRSRPAPPAAPPAPPRGAGHSRSRSSPPIPNRCQRPGEADGGILSAGEEHERRCREGVRALINRARREGQSAAGGTPLRRRRRDRYLSARSPANSIRRTGGAPHGRAIYFPDAGSLEDLSRRQEGVREHLAVVLPGRQDRRRRRQRLG